MKRNSSVFQWALGALAAMALGLVNASAANATAVSTPTEVSAPGSPSSGNPAQVPVLRYGVNEAAKMFQSGVDKGTIIKFIKDTAVPYNLSAEEILYLHNLGMPSDVINALIQRGAQLQQEREVPPPVVIAEGNESYPVYSYVYPDADYFDYGWPDYFYGGPVFIGKGWGHGGGWWHGGFHGGFHGGGFHGGHGGFGGGHGGGGHR